jgi:hypothetical protein
MGSLERHLRGTRRCDRLGAVTMMINKCSIEAMGLRYIYKGGGQKKWRIKIREER